MYQELVYFPRGRYMDQADALAWLGHMIRDMVSAPTQEEIEYGEFLEDKRSTFDEFDHSPYEISMEYETGRDEWGGY